MRTDWVLVGGVVLCLFVTGVWAANPEPAKPDAPKDTPKKEFAGKTADPPANAEAREKAGTSPKKSTSADRAVEKRKKTHLHQFMERDGSITFTNTPEKYRVNPSFVEVDIHYQPIAVPLQYRGYASASQYPASGIQELIHTYATTYRLDEDLVYAVIKAESDFNPNAVSSKGARGLMQLMPGTAAEMGVTNIFDPAQNIAGGTQYLAKMMDLFHDRTLAVAAYNAGPEAVKQYNGIPPYDETKNYVKKVLNFHRWFKSSGAKVRSEQVARVPGATAPPPVLIADTDRYVVHFTSGLTQPADRVVEKDAYYYIQYGRRIYPVKKELVKHIQEPA